MIAKTTKETTENGETIGIVLGGRPIKNMEIAESLGTSLRSAERNISRLKKYGYIDTKRTPYGNIFKVKNSKKFYKDRTAKNGGTKKREPPNMDREPPLLVERTAKNGGNKEDIKDIKDINTTRQKNMTRTAPISKWQSTFIKKFLQLQMKLAYLI